MKLKNKLDNDMEQAWGSLHQRLEEDGLLLSGTDPEQPRLHRKTVLAWAASVAVLIVAFAAFFLLRREQPIAAETLVLFNGQNQPTLVATLEDGSTVYLGGETTIEYPQQFATDKREVALTGKAFFEISRNTACPFVIDTKQAIIEVLGTSFSVEATEEELFALSVRNGEVRVISKLTGQTTHVTAGLTALMHSGQLETVDTAGQERFKSYFSSVYFKDQTLGNVLRVMNEKNAGSLEITCSPELADRKFNVAFANESPEEIAGIICAGLGLRYTRRANSAHITPN